MEEFCLNSLKNSICLDWNMDLDCTKDSSTSSKFSAEMGSSDDYLNDETLTDELANEAISLMKKKLPTYIVNSFIATGYDTLDVIADLTNEDITEIEPIIKHDFVGYDQFVNHATGKCIRYVTVQIPTWTPKRIQKFIEGTKYLVKEKTRENESLKH